jgi:phage tail-like protein
MATYPLSTFHFSVDWGGTRIGFTEVSGLDWEIDPISYRDGASPEYHKTKMPGMQKFSDITLSRGVFQSDNDYYTWMNTVNLNSIEKRDVTISMLNEAHEPIVTWQIKQAFPIKISGPSLKSDGNEIAIEKLVLAHEGIVFVND